MKQQLLSAWLSFLLVPMGMATDAYYINNGIVSTVFPPTPAPVIDASNFVNYGIFQITNLFSESVFTPPPPYDTWNTLNFANYGTMAGDSGFRFNYFDSNTSLNRRAASFVNQGPVTETNASIYGQSYVLVSATNVINRGALTTGIAGLLKLNGDNIDLTRSFVGVTPSANIQNWYWGVDTNFLGALFTPTLVSSSPTLCETIGTTFLGTVGYVPFFQILELTNGFTAHISITSTGPDTQDVDALFLSNTNPAVATEVRFFPGFIGQEKAVQWLGTATNRATGEVTTELLYLDDTFNEWLLTPALVPSGNFFFNISATTFRPSNYELTDTFPLFDTGTLIPPGAFSSALFRGTNVPTYVTNAGYGAKITAGPFVVDPSIQGATYTNLPGRIEITADKVLDLTRVRIGGQSYMQLNATNHFAGTRAAHIVSPYSDFNLRTTNSTLSISNLTTPVVPHFAGTCEVWSGRWTNVDSTGLASRYNVTVVDSRLATETPSQIQNLTLRATNVVVSDALNVFGSLLLPYTTTITITTNEVNAPSAFGELNLSAPDLVWASSFPLLQSVTNFGRITTGNSVFFGGARRPPWFTGSFDEPYQSFVTHGYVASQGNDTWANYFEASRSIDAGIGPFSLRSTTALLTNGVVLATNADISISTASLLVSNEVFQAGRGINLNVTGDLDDGTLFHSADFVIVTNTTGTNPVLQFVAFTNTWSVANGINLPVKPTLASLLGTTIYSKAYPNANVVSTWAGTNMQSSPDGFVNNAAIGRLILDGGEDSVFTFAGAGPGNALYVDYIELRNFTTNRDVTGTNFLGLNLAGDMKVFFAQAIASGVSIAEKLDGKNGGGFCWVSNYHCGLFSSTNLVYRDGTVHRLNAALAASCNIDSDGDGHVNCDPAGGDPIPAASLPDCTIQPVIVVGGTNVPPGGDSSTNSASTNALANGRPTLEFPAAPGHSAGSGFALAKGTYNGLFYETNGVNAASSGYFTASTTERATYSGRISLAGATYSLAGAFDHLGNASKTIARPAGSLRLELQLDLAGGDQIHGHVSSGNWSAELLADRLVFNKSKNPASSYAGNYTIFVPGTERAGSGFGSVKVDAGGALQWSATLADGSKVTQKSALSRQGIWPLYASLYGGTGVALSWIQFDRAREASDLEGQFIWIKPNLALAKYYPSGFTNDVAAVGSRYTRPASGSRELIFDGGGLSQPFTNAITLGPSGRLTSFTGPRLSLSITASSGLFKGSTLNPDSGLPLLFQGALFEKGNSGAGFFLVPERSGRVYLNP